MNTLLLTSALLIHYSTLSVSGIKNSPSSTGDSSSVELSIGGRPDVALDALQNPARNRDDRISRPDRNFIITHEGILNYNPVSRSLHNLDQEYKASATFTRSEVIPVPQNGGGRASYGRSLQDNSLFQVQPGNLVQSRDTHPSYTVQNAVSVPLHVGFQVEDAPTPVRNVRMNPKGKVLSANDDLNSAPTNYQRKVVPQQLGAGLSVPQPFRSSDLKLAESSHVPSTVFGQRVASSDPSSSQITKLHSVHHQPSAHQMDLHNSASSQYYQQVPSDQKFMNPYFNRMNDLDNAASDPREAYEAFQNSGNYNGNYAGSNFAGNWNQKAAGKDQSHDETKVYSDVNGGGAKSYQDYMTAGDLESKKYLSGRYGDVEDAGSGHYEGQIPVHFGFQVEHPRLQYPPKSSFADKYHSDHHIPTKVSSKVKIPRIPKPSAKFSIEDVDDEVDSDFKHIKIKKYSTNNDELPIPSTYNARYSDEIPNQSRHNFKYVSSSSASVDPHHGVIELQRSATNQERQAVLPNHEQMKLSKRTPTSQYQQNQQVQQQSEKLHQHYQQSQQYQGQASQKYYQYVKPQNMQKKAGSQVPSTFYV